MDRKMFDTPVLPRLETILAEIKSGDLVIPEFQRPFVWEDELRLSLLDSIAQGMPIGSLLVWRTSRRDLKTYKQVGGIQLDSPHKSDEKIGYLIDGHQRISTLFGALYSGVRQPQGDSDEDPDDDNVRWPLYFELGSEERPAFRLPPRRGPVPNHWLPLDTLLDGDKLFDFTQRLREAGQRDLAKQAERLANIFRDYVIPIVPLVTDELNIVTDAFVRINSQGKNMSEAHMLRALTYLGSLDTDAHFAKVREQLAPLGWGNVDDQVLVNALKAQLDLDVYASDVRGVRSKLQQDPTPLLRLGNILEEAVTFLAQNGVRGPDSLPYTYQLITLATLAAQSPGILSKEENRGVLLAWFWTTTYTEHFSGITGSRIREGINQLAAGLKEDSKLGPQSLNVKPLAQLRGSTGRTRAFMIFLCLLPKSEEAIERRQAWLEVSGLQAAPALFPRLSTGLPGNRVIASPIELRALRAALKNRQISAAMADEFAIPAEAIAALPDAQAFVAARGRYLRSVEANFIESFGLRISDTGA